MMEVVAENSGQEEEWPAAEVLLESAEGNKLVDLALDLMSVMECTHWYCILLLTLGLLHNAGSASVDETRVAARHQVEIHYKWMV